MPRSQSAPPTLLPADASTRAARRAMWLAAAALAPIAASTGTIIASLNSLGDGDIASGSGIAGAFVAAHVLGTLAGAALFGARLRGSPPRRRTTSTATTPTISRPRPSLAPRPIVAAALVISASLQLLMSATSHPYLLLLLRFADGIAHVGALMTLMGATATGDPEARARRMSWLGSTIVAGVGIGLGLGGELASHGASVAFLAGALLTAAAIVPAIAALPPVLPAAETTAAPRLAPRLTFPPAALTFGERFGFGVLTVTLTIPATTDDQKRAIGIVLGVFMLVSLVAMFGAHRAAARVGAASVRRSSILLLAIALAAVGFPVVMGSLSGRLAWALVGGLGAGGAYAAALQAAGRAPDARSRSVVIGIMQGAGSLGHALGALIAGALLPDPASGASASSAVATAALISAAVALAAGAASDRVARTP